MNLAALVLAPEYSLFGEDPLPYHLTSYAFRLLGAVTLFWLLNRLWPVSLRGASDEATPSTSRGLLHREERPPKAKHVYRSPVKPDITKTPLSRFDLIDVRDYSSMALQFSRGCPFNCEFCDITKLFGRNPRTKTNEQILTEFYIPYSVTTQVIGYRLSVIGYQVIGEEKAVIGYQRSGYR